MNGGATGRSPLEPIPGAPPPSYRWTTPPPSCPFVLAGGGAGSGRKEVATRDLVPGELDCAETRNRRDAPLPPYKTCIRLV